MLPVCQDVAGEPAWSAVRSDRPYALARGCCSSAPRALPQPCPKHAQRRAARGFASEIVQTTRSLLLRARRRSPERPARVGGVGYKKDRITAIRPARVAVALLRVVVVLADANQFVVTSSARCRYVPS
jgi:hypothetical protein